MLALPTVAFAPSVLADGAGLSGQCYNEDASQGGQDEARVDTTTGLEAGLDPAPGNHGITDALVMFATGTAQDGGQTGSACDRYDCYASQSVCQAAGQDARYDYLEADAKVGSVYVQVCYRGTASVAGDCPQHPTGPG